MRTGRRASNAPSGKESWRDISDFKTDICDSLIRSVRPGEIQLRGLDIYAYRVARSNGVCQADRDTARSPSTAAAIPMVPAIATFRRSAP